jgi:PDZ domain-containing secreted protein
MTDKKDKFETQSNNPGAWVGVRSGEHEETKEDTTEIIIQDKENDDHTHIGISVDGDEVFREDR